MFDMSALPDGTILIDRNNMKWVKGPHPVAVHVQPAAHAPVCMWMCGRGTEKSPPWNRVQSDGRAITEDGSHIHQHDIVSYEVQAVEYRAPAIITGGIPALFDSIQREMLEETPEIKEDPTFANYRYWATARMAIEAELAAEREQAQREAKKSPNAKPAISGLGMTANHTHLFGGWGAR